MTTIEARVRRGALMLDTEIPGWARKINEAELNLANCERCVLGQVYGHYADACETLGITGWGPTSEATAIGFQASVDQLPETATFQELRRAYALEMTEYKALATAWLAEIRARLDEAPVPVYARINADAMVTVP